ncbi:predicted protein [Naegleria gruberi]|uniref:Predicted protein n=1 Tax=Naegleria gruberi TaxID=5762 RepID=D2VII9_NAEGR|nr:uncharacterized protein NAEGRDRAFT_34412 [Naegleria gruberi]EFC43274.1 predicted protein [Naegleria gruberi]|eukprot:XP_002676018.1 predicted protein [Naegleria gruberi strain NEG-M]
MSSNNNQSKLVVITGASSGIGATTAVEFAAKGYKLLLLARRLDRLEQLVKDSSNSLSFENTVIHQCDIIQVDQIKEGIEKAKKQFNISSVDCLINNAGVMLLQPLLTQPLSDQNQMFDTNVKGLLNASHAVLKEMVENKQGTIINISSIAGTKSFPSAAAYCGTKHAVHAISETLRSEVAGSKVRVVIVSPGFTESELLGHNEKENSEGFEAMVNSWEMGALKSKDIADAILYAYEAPKHVCVREIKLAPTEQTV